MNAVHMCAYVQWKESGTIYIYQAALAARGGEVIWSAVSRCVRKCMVVEMFGSAWCEKCIIMVLFVTSTSSYCTYVPIFTSFVAVKYYYATYTGVSFQGCPVRIGSKIENSTHQHMQAVICWLYQTAGSRCTHLSW